MDKKKDSKKLNIGQFKPKGKLNPKIFKKDGTMDSQVRLQLLDIADDFVKSVEINWVKPLGYTVVGSMANYNWNPKSDIDIHISYDFSKIFNKKDFVKNYFMSKRNEWDKLHDKLRIKGYKVEITVVDKNDNAVTNGIYDLEKNKWDKEPQDLNDPKWSESYIKSSCLKKMEKIDRLCDAIDNESDTHKIESLEQKLNKLGEDLIELRKNGLKTKQKELSSGNIIVKVLRNCGYIDKLWKYVNMAYDKRNSLKENTISRGYFNTYVHKSAETPPSEFEKSKQKTIKISQDQVDEIRKYLKK